MKKEQIKLTNTLTRKKEIFKPINNKELKLYTCGPTVYQTPHIGNLRYFIFVDTLKKTLELAGYKVKHIMNITDVGHLTSDADEGEDKLQKEAKKQKKTAWEISRKYTQIFKQQMKELNIKKPTKLPKATQTIKEQIQLIKKLEQKKYTYKTHDGIYYNTLKFKKYTQLSGTKSQNLQAGKRIKIGDKKNKTDFALWKFSPKNEKRDMEWNSPWGKGFPGWHIECSAIAIKNLGQTIDIHTGGIDHIPIHHTNEIAQSEIATNKKFSNYWLHSEFLVMKNQKMSKSKGNIKTLEDIKKFKVSPLAYRYLCLGTHYKKRMLYDQQILINAQNSYTKLEQKIIEIKQNINKTKKQNTKETKYLKKFKKEIFNDLNTPQTIATIWQVINDKKVTNKQKINTILEIDKVLGLRIKQMKKQTIPLNIQKLFNEREKYRKNKNWQKSDEIRQQLHKLGYMMNDTKEKSTISKI